MYHGAAVADAASIPADRLIARYERNGTGVVTKEEDSNTAMLYSFDIFGRLIEAHDRTLEKSVRYGYDTRSLRSKMEVVDYTPSATGTVSMTVAYGYDDAGRLKTVKKDNDPAAVYEYDLSGRRIGLTLPNGVSTAYTYDSADRLLDLTTGKDVTVLASFAYTLDPTGNRTGITYGDGSRSLYEFDTAYRLTRDLRVDSSNETLYDEAYTYDAVGNRLTKVRTGWNPVHAINTYNARNQLVSTTGSESKTYSYDANGNTIATTSGRDVETMEYDVLSRMTRYQGQSGVEETTYRGSEWHRWNVSGQTAVTSFLYDDDDVVADYEGSSPLLSRHYVTPTLDENLSVTIASSLHPNAYYYAQDGLGNAIMLSDASGNILNSYDFTSFGEQYSSTESVEQRYGYTGREKTNLTDGMHYRYRTYDPSSGRFPGRDPLGYGPDINVYSYVANMPYRFVDPYGLELYLCGPKGFKENIARALRKLCSKAVFTGKVDDPCWKVGFSECPEESDQLCTGIYEITQNDWPNSIWPLNEKNPEPRIRYGPEGELTKLPNGQQKKGEGSAGAIYSSSGDWEMKPEVYSNINDPTGSLSNVTLPLPAVLAHELGHMYLVNRGAQPGDDFNQNRQDSRSVDWENQALKRIGSPWRRMNYWEK